VRAQGPLVYVHVLKGIDFVCVCVCVCVCVSGQGLVWVSVYGQVWVGRQACVRECMSRSVCVSVCRSAPQTCMLSEAVQSSFPRSLHAIPGTVPQIRP
jgi:hypothetical protein